MKAKKWIVFAVVAVGAVFSQFYIQQRYTSMLLGGGEYQWPVQLERSVGWIPSDYLNVKFLGTQALWSGPRPPQTDQRIYVRVKNQSSGILAVQDAVPDRPSEGEYITATVDKYANGIVEFRIPFNRVNADLKKVNPRFYQQPYKGTLLATLKLKDGRGVVTGVYAKGVTIENAQPENADGTPAGTENGTGTAQAAVTGGAGTDSAENQ